MSRKQQQISKYMGILNEMKAWKRKPIIIHDYLSKKKVSFALSPVLKKMKWLQKNGDLYKWTGPEMILQTLKRYQQMTKGGKMIRKGENGQLSIECPEISPGSVPRDLVQNIRFEKKEAIVETDIDVIRKFGPGKSESVSIRLSFRGKKSEMELFRKLWSRLSNSETVDMNERRGA